MRRVGPLVSVLACAAGCQQLLGLDEYQPAGDDAGYDATQTPSPEGAMDTGAVDRATGGDGDGADVTTGADVATSDGYGRDAESDSVVVDVGSKADSSTAADSSDDASNGADAFAALDSADAGSADVVHVADAPAEAADSATVNTCPQQTPPGATTCCGHSACIARQGNACQCGECSQSHCAGMCCFDSNGTFSCVASPSDCH
jgi:hypothetical protein